MAYQSCGSSDTATDDITWPGRAPADGVVLCEPGPEKCLDAGSEWREDRTVCWIVAAPVSSSSHRTRARKSEKRVRDTLVFKRSFSLVFKRSFSLVFKRSFSSEKETPSFSTFSRTPRFQEPSPRFQEPSKENGAVFLIKGNSSEKETPSFSGTVLVRFRFHSPRFHSFSGTVPSFSGTVEREWCCFSEALSKKGNRHSRKGACSGQRNPVAGRPDCGLCPSV